MQTEQLSPRDKFLKERQAINEHIDQNKKTEDEDNGVPHVSESEIDEVERNMEKQKIDKTMGKEKHPVTRLKNNAEQLKLQMGLKHLNKNQVDTLNQVFEKAGEVNDPVLNHLVKKRAETQQRFDSLKVHINELNKKIMEELNLASQDLLKTQGVMENLDNQILDYVAENKGLI